MINSLAGLFTHPDASVEQRNKNLVRSAIADGVMSAAMVALTIVAHFYGVSTELQNALISATVIYGVWTLCRVKHTLNNTMRHKFKRIEHLFLTYAKRLNEINLSPGYHRAETATRFEMENVLREKAKDQLDSRIKKLDTAKNVIAGLTLVAGLALIVTAFVAPHFFSPDVKGAILGASIPAVAWAICSLAAAILLRKQEEQYKPKPEPSIPDSPANGAGGAKKNDVKPKPIASAPNEGAGGPFEYDPNAGAKEPIEDDDSGVPCLPSARQTIYGSTSEYDSQPQLPTDGSKVKVESSHIITDVT